MGYSKEAERQNKALSYILKGVSPDKRIFVSMVGTSPEEIAKAKQKELDEAQASSDFSVIMQRARVPMFCPKCESIMSKPLDAKMYRIYDHCFDCQITLENKMRIDGTYEDFATNKVLKNRKAWLIDTLVGLDTWKDNYKVEYLNQTAADTRIVDTETWLQDNKHTETLIAEAITHFTTELKEIEEVLNEK